MSDKSYTQRKAEWATFHRSNPEIFEMFVRFSEEARRRGRTRLSPWLIINRVRWETAIATTGGDGYKIPNGHIGFYSRLYMSQDPKNRGKFFSIRSMVGEDFEATRIACGFTDAVPEAAPTKPAKPVKQFAFPFNR